MLVSSDKNKITTKLQNDHHWELPEVWRNRSPTTVNIQKMLPRDWWEGQRSKTGWSHNCMGQLRIERDILAAEVSLEE